MSIFAAASTLAVEAFYNHVMDIIEEELGAENWTAEFAYQAILGVETSVGQTGKSHTLSFLARVDDLVEEIESAL